MVAPWTPILHLWVRSRGGRCMNARMELIDTVMELLDVCVSLRHDISDLDDQWESPLIDCRIEIGCYQLLQLSLIHI